MKDLRQNIDTPMKIYEDNRGCIGMAMNLEIKRVKHMDIKHHFIREQIGNGSIEIHHVRSEEKLVALLGSKD